MADEPLNPTPVTPAAASFSVAPTPAAPAAPAVPEDYEALKQFRETYEPTLQAIAPYLDDIRPIVEDEDERAYIRQARESRRLLREQAKPQIPPEFQPVVDRFEERLGPLVEYVNNDKAAREAREAATLKSAQETNLAYANRLLAERPDLGENNFAGMYALGALAARDQLPLEEAWKRYGNQYAAPTKKEAPPRSLRGDAAAPGVPGESTEPPIRSSRDLTKRLAANLRAGGMKG